MSGAAAGAAPEGLAPEGVASIGDYAVVGDLRSSALISPAGSLDWLCWPAFDAPAVFCRLLDEERGGACGIAVEGLRRIERAYLDRTAVLRTRFATATGLLELLDFMPLRALDAPTGPDAAAQTRVIRYARCLEGEVAFAVDVRPTFDFARAPHRWTVEGGRTVARAGEGRLVVDASSDVRPAGEAARARARLRAGEDWFLALTWGDAPPPEGVAGVEARLEATCAYWRGWSERFTYAGPFPALALRSAITLKLATHAPSGGIVAAPTTSLPEAIPGDRTFDYRYAWLRDAGSAGSAFAQTGFARETAELLRFVLDADATGGRDLRCLYGLTRPVPEEETLEGLSGYRGVGPVRLGNGARDQSQRDIYGETLMTVADYVAAAGGLPDALRERLAPFVVAVAETAAATWREPDSGIWELRGPPRRLLHSTALCAVALDRAAEIVERCGVPGGDQARWRATAAEIRADAAAGCWNERRRAYVQGYDGDALDASALRAALFGGLAMDDPRLDETIATIRRDLMRNGFVDRYDAPDGFAGEEGAFIICTLWLAGCRARRGDLDEAQALFARVAGRAGPLGLFAEELDPSGRLGQLGNFPQSLTHSGFLSNDVRTVWASAPVAAPPRLRFWTKIRTSRVASFSGRRNGSPAVSDVARADEPREPGGPLRADGARETARPSAASARTSVDAHRMRRGAFHGNHPVPPSRSAEPRASRLARRRFAGPIFRLPSSQIAFRSLARRRSTRAPRGRRLGAGASRRSP